MLIKLDDKREMNILEAGEGQTIVLLHGNGEDLRIYRKLQAALAVHFHVISIDSPGHGRSYMPEQYHYPDMARDIHDTIRLLVEDRPLIVGFSDGGIIALLMAIEYPTLAAGLVICGANISIDGLVDSALDEMRAQVAGGARSPLTELMLNQADIPLDALRRIRIPVMVTAGEHDVIKHEHTGLIAAALAKSTLIYFEGEDHSSYVIDSAFLATRISEFRELIEVDQNTYEDL